MVLFVDLDEVGGDEGPGIGLGSGRGRGLALAGVDGGGGGGVDHPNHDQHHHRQHHHHGHGRGGLLGSNVYENVSVNVGVNVDGNAWRSFGVGLPMPMTVTTPAATAMSSGKLGGEWGNVDVEGEHDGKRSNPNINGFSAALSCYPIVKQITRSLDLNTLHALSRTCRQFRANLLQFRYYLVTHSLRCENDDPFEAPSHGRCFASGNANGHIHNDWRNGFDDNGNKGKLGLRSFEARRLTSGKVGRCARDMVGECRKCGVVVCRNCVVKPPPPATLGNRHRRLCSACLEVPIEVHTTDSSLLSFPSNDEGLPEIASQSFTASAFARMPCSCEDAVWLCQPCGQSRINADTTYKRVWTWRTRYSTYLGGLGTGIGEGHEGVKCGRGASCLAAKDLEVEIDCSAEDMPLLGQVESHSSESSGEEDKPGYLRQEIEGIGGVVKKKVKKRVRVGATVREHEDEREKAGYLEREVKGLERSWCGWCSRIISSVKDPN